MRSDTIFAGYYKDPEATAAALTEDGWFRTGDVGEIDADGFVKITDRKKDIIITAGGKNIAPQNLENALKASRFVSQALIVGDRRPYVTALITLDWDEVNASGRDPQKLVEELVEVVNRDRVRVEQIKRFRVLPTFWEPGGEGEERRIALELKLIADVGLVGKPNAGKSTLLAAISAATPKIADYPFTTLQPNLGVVKLSDHRTFVMADIPGIIEGAHAGKGLGLQFLRHVERCAALVHVLDCATLDPGRDPISDLEAIEHELEQYGGTEGDLADRPRLVALNKIDVPEARELADLVTPLLQERGYTVGLDALPAGSPEREAFASVVSVKVRAQRAS